MPVYMISLCDFFVEVIYSGDIIVFVSKFFGILIAADGDYSQLRMPMLEIGGPT